MTASIITIGDEILIGQIVDTNSAWIAARLNEAGIVVHDRLSVGDDAADIGRALDTALRECDLVITTGGLGPTKDDITKNVIAGMFGCGMVMHEPTYKHIERMLAARGVAFNGLNRSQALVPSCATVLHNANGTAPGMWFERAGHILVSLPGVPFEMEGLMSDEVMPRLRKLGGGGGIVHRTMITSGIAESILAERIAEWENGLPANVKLAYLPSPTGVRLRLSAYGVDVGETDGLFDRLFGDLERIIPRFVVGYGEESAESSLARLLTDRGATLALAESCTGGRIASRLTALAGASGYLLCGVVSYSNEAKINILGVRAEDIARYGAVSSTVAEQMAAGVRRISGADYAIAATGIAGPEGGSEEKPVGTVWIAVASPAGITARLHHFGNLRAQNIERAATAGINMLRETILGSE